VGKSLLAGTALWTVPALLFAPGLLGRLPYDAGLAAMVAALVNLHHFVLDGVIWKLRESRIARVLLVGASPEGGATAPQADATARASGAVRLALWGSGAALLAVSVAWAVLVVQFNHAFERADLDAARRAAERLASAGQANAEMHLRVGQAYLARGETTAAEVFLERSLAIHPTAWGWTGIGDVHARRQEWADAERAYARALELEPSHTVATFHAAVVALDRGQADRARRGLLRARTLASADREAPAALVASIEQVLGDERLDGTR
jgi:tetratricopeptide (TPR) repeat protein